MIKEWKRLSNNAKKVCIADFFWNLGRTLPHAILTIFLLYNGCSLTQIAFLQSIFMVVAMLTEFPSGVLADVVSRKKVYLLSMITLFISYILIGFYSQCYMVLCISYIFYGLSVSLKSGTLEAQVILELNNDKDKIKTYSVVSSYVISSSSIIGGLFGSVLYSYIKQKIYIISLMSFIVAFVSAELCCFHNPVVEMSQERSTLKEEIIDGFSTIKESNILKYVLILFAISTLFLQPFFQYWQVYYKEYAIDEKYFGIIYVLFQFCNIIGTYFYKKINFKPLYAIILLLLIPIIFIICVCFKIGTIIALPIAVTLFYIYSMHLNVIQKQYAPLNHISSFFSLVGTIENVASIGSLFIMAMLINLAGIKYAYTIIFLLFVILALGVQIGLEKTVKRLDNEFEKRNCNNVIFERSQ